MILISHYVFIKDHIPIPSDAVLRVNIAWMKNTQEAEHILNTLTHDVYLDYPQGRSKPPRPKLSLDEAIEFAHRFSNVKYFAVSNAEDPDEVFRIKSRLPKDVEFIPKIETRQGIENLKSIVKKINARHIMLDKEDLYTDIDLDSDLFEELVALARQKTEQSGAEILELQGVLFSTIAPQKAHEHKQEQRFATAISS